jgi:hypothetical protein
VSLTLRHAARSPLITIAILALVLFGCSGADSSIDGGSVGTTLPAATESEPEQQEQQEQPTPSVPSELVGRWNGGSNEKGHWYYEFYPDGTYRAWPAYQDNPAVATGTIDVTPAQITFSNGGNPLTVMWYIADGILFMDDYSYVRA